MYCLGYFLLSCSTLFLLLYELRCEFTIYFLRPSVGLLEILKIENPNSASPKVFLRTSVCTGLGNFIKYPMSRTVHENTRTRRSSDLAVWAVQCTTGSGLDFAHSRQPNIIYLLPPSASPSGFHPSAPPHPSSPHAPRPAARDSHPLGSRALSPKLRDTTQSSGTLCLEDAGPRHSECLGDSEAARIRQSQFRVVNLPQGLATPEVSQERE